MADRSVNININYKVNTVEVQRGEQAVNRSVAATNNLNAASQKAATNATKGYTQVGRSIESMKLRMDQLKAQIQLTSSTDTARLQKLSAEYKKLDTQVRQLNQTYLQTNKATSAATQGTKSLVDQFGNLYNGIRLIVTAGLVREFVDTALAAASLSGKVDGVSRAFARLPNSELLMQRLKNATRNTVTELELMQRAIQASNFGVDLQALPELLEFAAVRAQQTGESVDYLVDSIVRGIGRKSILILDNLGISATRLKEEFNGASLASQSVAEVTQAVGRIAKEELERMGGYAENAATKVDGIKVKYEELRVILSRRVTSTALLDYLNEILETLSVFAEAFELGDTINNIGKITQKREAQKFALSEVTRLEKELIELDKTSNLTQQQKNDFIQQEINSRVDLIGRYNDEISRLKERNKLLYSDELKKTLPALTDLVKLYGRENEAGKIGNFLTKEQRNLRMELNAQLEKERESIGKNISANKNNVVQVQATIDALLKYLDAMQKVNTETAEQLGIIDKLEEDITAISDAIGAAKSEREIKSLTVQLRIMNEELDRLRNLDRVNDVNAPRAFDIRQNVQAAADFTFKSNVTPESIQADLDKLTGDLEAKAEVTLTPSNNPSAWENIRSEFMDNWQNITTEGIMNTTDVLNSFVQAELDSYNVRLDALRTYYDEQINLAGNNERSRTELAIKRDREEQKLRRKAFEAEKDAKRKQTVINGAAGVINAFATLPYPAAIVAAALIAGKTISELAIIDNQRYAGYAKGVLNLKGPGSETSDSIPARLSKGESVMTAAETKNSFGILKEIRAKRLNDDVMKSIRQGNEKVSYVGMNDTRIVKEIRALRESQPDIVKQNNMIYEVRKKRDGYRQRIRSKSMSI
jgi:S-adenosylmethionine hydrolase